MAAAKRAKMGRPPAGPRGQRTSEWPITTVRLSAEHRQLLSSLAGALSVPKARVVALALEHYASTVPVDTPSDILRTIRASNPRGR